MPNWNWRIKSPDAVTPKTLLITPAVESLAVSSGFDLLVRLNRLKDSTRNSRVVSSFASGDLKRNVFQSAQFAAAKPGPGKVPP